MSNQIQVVPQQGAQMQYQTPSQSEWTILQQQAAVLVKTGFLPASIKTPEQAIAIILTGRELNIPQMVALRSITVIQGNPTVSPQLMLALINRSGLCEDIDIQNNEDANATWCEVTMKRRGRSPHTEVFGDEEAARMGLNTKDNYKKQKATMYRWRCIAACARVVFPDVILGLYTPDELGAETNTDGEPVALPAQNVPEPVRAAPPNSAREKVVHAVGAYNLTSAEQIANKVKTGEGDPRAAEIRAEVEKLSGDIGLNAAAVLKKLNSLDSVEKMEEGLLSLRRKAVKDLLPYAPYENPADFLAEFGITAIDEADSESLGKVIENLRLTTTVDDFQRSLEEK